MGFFLTTLLSGVTMSSVICVAHALVFLKFTSRCASCVPVEAALFCMIALISHAIIWFLTFSKRDVSLGDEWVTTPVIRLMVRDGSWVLVSVGAIIAATIPYSLKVCIPADLSIPISLSFASFCTCRLILNMKTLHIQPSGSEVGEYLTIDEI